MHLFGDASGPHIAHFHARHENGCVELDWEVRNADDLRWRVLRSEWGFAGSAEAPGTNGQVLVNESAETYLTDRGLDPSKHFWYTVFSQEPDDTWCKQVEVKLRPHDLLGWVHPGAQSVVDAEASLARTPTDLHYLSLTGRERYVGWKPRSTAVGDWLTMDGGD